MKIEATSLDAYRLMHDGVLALARAERVGIRCDVDYIETQKKLLTKKINRLEKKLKDSKFYRHWEHSSKSKINIYSDTQLRIFLYTIKKLEPTKTTTSGKGSTDEESLTALNIPELSVLIQCRKLQKIRDTYLEGFLREQVNGIIHPSFNLHLVKTFRSSSDRPNFQNIPMRDEESMLLTRRALFPRRGHQLACIDYSGLEFNINACYSKDPVMVEYCNDPSSDIHADIARQTFLLDNFDKSIPDHKVLRSAAKNGFVFPQLYGDYYKNCASNLACNWGHLSTGKWKKGEGVSIEDTFLSDHLMGKGIQSLSDYEEHIRDVQDKFFDKFAVHSRYMKTNYRNYIKTGKVMSHTGFTMSGVMTKNQVLNAPVQGSAFHCLLWAFTRLDKVLDQDNYKTRLIGQIHDELVLDICPPELSKILTLVREITCVELPKAWKWIIVPLSVDAEVCGVDESWANKKKIDIP